MPVRLQSKNPLIDLEAISGIESRLGVKLPDEYRQFLLTYNVAVPEQNQYVGSAVTTSVECFWGISKVALDDLFEQNRTVYDGRLPARVLAIARAGGGNLICINLADGSVYFWDHEGEATDDERPSFQNMAKLANSLASFLEALQPFRLDDFPSNAKIKSVELKPGFAEKFKKFM